LGLVGLHASFTVSDETIRAAGELCRALAVPMHVHVAEDRADVEDAQRRGYRDPLDRLLRCGHCRRDRSSRMGCISTTMRCGAALTRGCGWYKIRARITATASAIPEVFMYRDGWRLGTDGYPANMTDEEAALSQHAEAAGDDPTAVTARRLAAWSLLAEHFALPFAPLAAWLRG
jgi:hypothetical protein